MGWMDGWMDGMAWHSGFCLSAVCVGVLFRVYLPYFICVMDNI